MSTPALTSFAAPQGGAASFGAARQEAKALAPKLTSFAAPQGGAASFGAARQEA